MLDKKAFEDFEKRMEKLVEELSAPINDIRFPDRVYHYTNSAGLAGILESGKLWLNDVFRQNDPSEVIHGYEAAINVLIQQASRRNAQHSKEIALYIQNLMSTEGMKESARFFSLSFSAERDDLSQWRAYADDGRGFALGFDGKALEALYQAAQLHGGSASFEIQYDRNMLDKNLTQLANCVIDFIEASFPRASKHYFTSRQSIFRKFIDCALPLGLFHKHASYKGEREYRFLQICNIDDHIPGMMTRIRGPYKLVRYSELDWKATKPLLLKEIIVGPSNAQESLRFALDCLEVYLQNHRVGIDVIVSGIPYKTAL